MDGFWALAGFAGVVLLVLAPLFTILIMGARFGRSKRGENYSWTNNLTASPVDFKESFSKLRPK